MNASKEEATKHLVTIEDAMRFVVADQSDLYNRLQQARDFLLAAQRKLQSEAAYAKEKQRRKHLFRSPGNGQSCN